MAIFADYYVIETLEEEILPLSFVKSYLRVDNDDDDFLIKILTKSAIEYAENFTGLSIRQKLIEAKFYQNRSNKFNLPKIPIFSVKEVKIISNLAKIKLLNKNEYKCDSGSLTLIIEENNWTNLTVKYIAGHVIDNLASPITESIISHIAIMYDNRTGDITIPKRALNNYHMYKKARI